MRDDHRAQPRNDKAAYDRLLATWWTEYTKAAERDARSDQYSPLVNDYLTTMLSTRLNLTWTSEETT